MKLRKKNKTILLYFIIFFAFYFGHNFNSQSEIDTDIKELIHLNNILVKRKMKEYELIHILQKIEKNIAKEIREFSEELISLEQFTKEIKSLNDNLTEMLNLFQNIKKRNRRF
jgi:hypothetical protein